MLSVTLVLLNTVEKADAWWVGVIGKVRVQTDRLARVSHVVGVSADANRPMSPDQFEKGAQPLW